MASVTHSRRARSGIIALPLGLGLLIIGATCHDDCSGCLPDSPVDLTPHSIEVIPPYVSSTPNGSFTLGVRLRNAAGQLLPASAATAVQWDVPMGAEEHASLSSSSGATNDVRLTAATSPIAIAVGIGAVTGTVVVTPEAEVAPGKMDWIATDILMAGQRPAIALVDGRGVSGWISDTLVAFVGRGRVDEFGESPGEVTLFSSSRKLTRETPAWAAGDCDHVSFGTTMPATECYPRGPYPWTTAETIAARIWIMSDDPSISALAAGHFASASDFFRNAFTGLDLNAPPPDLLPGSSVVLDVGEDNAWTCPSSGDYSVKQQLLDAGLTNEAFSRASLNIVYVNAMLKPPERGGGNWAYPGYTCTWTDTEGVIVLISAAKHNNTTLVHELGHGLGPWDQRPWGHTKRSDGFDEANLMWPSAAPLVPASRASLTLGQAFRLSLDKKSFVIRAKAVEGTAGYSCYSIDTDVPCPKLAKDFLP